MAVKDTITGVWANDVVSEMRYKPWGEIRYPANGQNPGPSNYTYTGQYSHMGDFGLMFYNARWYDPSLGRFAQADSIVPGGVQGLDRYAYVNNSPTNYVDPTGHFTDTQLEDWFGKKWKNRFSQTMIDYLTRGQLGDILQYGDKQFAMFVLNGDGNLAMWHLGDTIDDNYLINLDEAFNGLVEPEESALYRPRTAGPDASDPNWSDLGPGEGIGDPWYGNPTYERIYSTLCPNEVCQGTYSLPQTWYQGSGENGHVSLSYGPVGFSDSNVGIGLFIFNLGESFLRGGINPATAIPSLVVGVADMFSYDTHYYWQPGVTYSTPQQIPIAPTP